MKRFTIVNMIFSSVLFLASCNSADTDVSVDSGRIYKASIAEGTRTALEQDGDIYHVNWVEGDLVAITDGVNTVYYKALAGGSTSTELRRSGGTDPVGEAVAFYPSNISAYNLPANQSYVADNIKNSPMMGTIDGDHISFKNLCGIVRLDVSALSDVKVRNIKLSADQGLSGTYTVKDNAAVVGGKGGVTLNCGSVAVGTGITHFFIALPANSYTGFSIEVNTADGSSFNFTAKTGAKLTVERSMVTILPILIKKLPDPVPAADLLDVVFAQDGSAKDVSANHMPATLVDGPGTVTWFNKDYNLWTGHFNHNGEDITSGYYKFSYAQGDATDMALKNGFSMECLFCIDKKSDGTLEWKMFSAMDSGGLGFLISKTANGCALTFLPNISTGSSSNYIWCSSSINPEPGRYYHAVGVYDKASATTSIYVDGELKGTKPSPGTYHRQSSVNSYWFAVGGDAASGKANSGWKGDVAIARVYSKSLTADDVAALYSEVKDKQTSREFFCIDNISLLGDCVLAAGNKYCIKGDGFRSGDRIRFESIADSGISYECETTIENGMAKALIPSGFTSGKYRIVALRGSAEYQLGKATITVGSTPTRISDIKVVAHRGLHTTATENSIAALKAAQNIDVYGSEFDIWITADGVCVVNHNSTFSGDSHVIKSSRYSDLSAVRLANGEKVPTLDAYLEQGLKKPSVKMICEIKDHGSADRNNACFDEAWRLVQEKKMEDQMAWITFSWDLCCYIHSKVPDAHVQYLCQTESALRTPQQVKDAGLSGIDYIMGTYNSHIDYIKTCASLGLVTNVWTVDSEADMVKYMYLGCNYITTNKPVELQALIRNPFIEE
ncbi:MAG: hypothetical protein MJY60_07125 [Bacteroidales bacterium]|nr:hypothetical protein [Bacteroidales bacterium]